MNTDTDSCFICGDDNQNALQTHHIVPRRHGGSDKDENLVRLCANCHQAIERLYNKRFYRKLGVADRDKAPGKVLDEIYETAENGMENAISNHESEFEEFPELNEYRRIPDETLENLGVGEWRGFHLGYYDALANILHHVVEDDEEIPMLK